jgi:hypothetical protein
MIVFGGTLGNGSSSNDVHCYDLQSSTWVQINTTGQPPPPRCGMSGFQHADRLFIFGGYNKASDQVFNDLWSLSLSRLEWSRVYLRGAAFLAPRYYHSFHITTDGCLFLLGGRGAKHELCVELEEFNLRASTIHRIGDSAAACVDRDSLASIMTYLHAVELSLCASVCKRWKLASESEACWYAICKRHGLVGSILHQRDSCKPLSYRRAFMAASPEVQRMREGVILEKYRERLAERMQQVHNRRLKKSECVLQ